MLLSSLCTGEQREHIVLKIKNSTSVGFTFSYLAYNHHKILIKIKHKLKKLVSFWIVFCLFWFYAIIALLVNEITT